MKYEKNLGHCFEYDKRDMWNEEKDVKQLT